MTPISDIGVDPIVVSPLRRRTALRSLQSLPMAETAATIELYTDGACSGNPGPGGWAYILKHPSSGKVVEQSGGEAATTNNRMELTAVIEGLKALERPCRVEVYSDSQYVCNGLMEWMEQWKAKGWRRGKRNEPVLNLELWKQLDQLKQTYTLTCHWIRGHSEHPENERCDQLAVAAAEQFKS